MKHDSIGDRGVVVIGGGVAGLAAAGYLARGGRAVTVVEKAPSPGGRAATDRQHGYALNRGIHALYTGGAASEVLRELGVHYAYGVPKHVFAFDARGLHRFPANAADLVRTSLFDAGDKRELLGFLLRLGGLRPTAHRHQSIADWISAAVRRPRTRQLLRSTASAFMYSVALDIISADIFIDRFQQAARHPVHYVDGGWQSLVDGLRDVATAAGARVVTSAPAAAIEFEDGLAVGVRVSTGAVLGASAVVLALPPREALDLLGERAGAGLRRTVADIVPGYVACLDLALSHLPSAEHPVVFDLDQPRFVSAQSTVAQLAPAGGAVIHAFKQLDPRQVTDPRRDRAELESLLDGVQPGWREVVVEQRFLPRMVGTEALPLVSQGGLGGRLPSGSADVPNVAFAGDWVGPRGWLVDASLASAREAAQLMLRASAVPTPAGRPVPLRAA